MIFTKYSVNAIFPKLAPIYPASCVVLDDGGFTDPDPVLFVQSSSALEDLGNGEAGVAEFRYLLSSPLEYDFSVSYATLQGSADAEKDYKPISGRLYVPKGTRAGLLNLPIVGDVEIEDAENFTLVLSPDIPVSRHSRIARSCVIFDKSR